MRTLLFRVVIAGALLATLGVGTPVAAPPIKTPPRFVDNGDGTVTDNQTGLMWEKKNTNVSDTYNWSDTGTAPDGLLFTRFLATMHCEITIDGTCGLAGHYDWRIPNISELRTIVDCTQPNCLDPIFGPTNISTFYYSGSTDATVPTNAWGIEFDNGNAMSLTNKFGYAAVRAVRGGK